MEKSTKIKAIPRVINMYHITGTELSAISGSKILHVMLSLCTFFGGLTCSTYISLFTDKSNDSEDVEYIILALSGLTLLFLILALYEAFKKSSIIREIRRSEQKGLLVQENDWNFSK